MQGITRSFLKHAAHRKLPPNAFGDFTRVAVAPAELRSSPAGPAGHRQKHGPQPRE